MEEIKVNDYVRTDGGLLFKVDEYWYHECLPELDNDTKSKLKKHSPNIIDLIEENDYVNGVKVLSVSTLELTVQDNGIRVWNKKSIARKIKSIVTHQQFNSIKYEVE